MGKYVELARRVLHARQERQPDVTATAACLEAEMWGRVAAVYHIIPPGYVPSAEWDTYEAPINGTLAEIKAAKLSGDVDRLHEALAQYEQFALAAAQCFVQALLPKKAGS